MTDARFEDGDEGPLHLLAHSGEDLTILAALVQDAVLSGDDIQYDRRRRRFVVLLNRFRWEDVGTTQTRSRPYERVRSLLIIEDVTKVRSQGITRGDGAQVLSLLALAWQPGEDGTGHLTLVLAGDGAIELSVEALDVRLQDVTKPYIAPSGQRPGHAI